jgi:hypothetical protein
VDTCGEEPVKTVAVVVVAVLFGLPNMGRGTEKKPVPPYRAESSAYVVKGKDAWTYVTENRSFRFAEVLGDEGNNYEPVLLLEETYHNERTDGMERYGIAFSVSRRGDVAMSQSFISITAF